MLYAISVFGKLRWPICYRLLESLANWNMHFAQMCYMLEMEARRCYHERCLNSIYHPDHWVRRLSALSWPMCGEYHIVLVTKCIHIYTYTSMLQNNNHIIRLITYCPHYKGEQDGHGTWGKTGTPCWVEREQTAPKTGGMRHQVERIYHIVLGTIA